MIPDKAADDAAMQLEGFCDACGFLNERGQCECSSCGQPMPPVPSGMARLARAGDQSFDPTRMRAGTEGQGCGDPTIAGEARRWQTQQRAQHPAGDPPRHPRAGRALIAVCIAGLCLAAPFVMTWGPLPIDPNDEEDLFYFSMLVSPAVALGTAIIIGLLLAVLGSLRLVATGPRAALVATVVSSFVAPLVYWALWIGSAILVGALPDFDYIGLLAAEASVLPVLCGAATVLSVAAWMGRRSSAQGVPEGQAGWIKPDEPDEAATNAGRALDYLTWASGCLPCLLTGLAIGLSLVVVAVA